MKPLTGLAVEESTEDVAVVDVAIEDMVMAEADAARHAHVPIFMLVASRMDIRLRIMLPSISHATPS